MSLENNTNELNQVLEMAKNIKPNSIPETTVYVNKEEGTGLRPINSEDTLELGQTIYVDTSKLSSIVDDDKVYAVYTDSVSAIALGNVNHWSSSVGCGIHVYTRDTAPYLYLELSPNSGVIKFNCPISGKITSLTDDTPFYIYVTTSKAVYNEQGETKQLDLSLLSDETGLLNQGGGGTSEKVIHITNWSNGDNIKFSMNGFSHFQILSGSTDGGCAWGYCDCFGYVTNKNASSTQAWGHMGVTDGMSNWCTKYHASMNYDATTDTVNINTNELPITSCGGQETGLSVYIRLLNVEEV